jgi:hypothetical protein
MKTKTRMMLSFAVIGLILTAFMGCELFENPTPEPVVYTIIVISNDGGTVGPSGKIEVLDGKNQTINFVPNAGYVIEAIRIDGNVIDSPSVFSYTFEKVTSNHKVEVTFKKTIVVIKKQYTIKASAGPGGSITPSGTIMVDSASNLTIVAKPDFGHKVTSLMINNAMKSPLSATGDTLNLSKITKDYEVEATFDWIPSYTTMATGPWTNDSIFVIASNDGSEGPGTTYASFDSHVFTFSLDGNYTYHDQVSTVNGKWSIDETTTPPTLNMVNQYGNIIWHIGKLNQSQMILFVDDVDCLGCTNPNAKGTQRYTYSHH